MLQKFLTKITFRMLCGLTKSVRFVLCRFWVEIRGCPSGLAVALQVLHPHFGSCCHTLKRYEISYLFIHLLALSVRAGYSTDRSVAVHFHVRTALLTEMSRLQLFYLLSQELKCGLHLYFCEPYFFLSFLTSTELARFVVFDLFFL